MAVDKPLITVYSYSGDCCNNEPFATFNQKGWTYEIKSATLPVERAEAEKIAKNAGLEPPYYYPIIIIGDEVISSYKPIEVNAAVEKVRAAQAASSEPAAEKE